MITDHEQDEIDSALANLLQDLLDEIEENCTVLLPIPRLETELGGRSIEQQLMVLAWAVRGA